jgi:hypothetical protein
MRPVHLIFGYEQFNIAPLTLGLQQAVAKDLAEKFPDATIKFFDDDSGLSLKVEILATDREFAQRIADICLWLGFELTRS